MIFRDNEATQGGAIATASDDVRLVVERGSFIGNWAAKSGGAVYVGGGTVQIASSSFQETRRQSSAARCTASVDRLPFPTAP